MESTSLKTVLNSPINENFEIQIKDFRAARESETKTKRLGGIDEDLNLLFVVSISPDGFDADTEGWLVVRAHVNPLRAKYSPQDGEVSWIVSVIDVEGNSRFPQSFVHDVSKKYSHEAKYLERSFIFNRADEILPKGVLTLRCDIFFQWYNVAPANGGDLLRKAAEGVLPSFQHFSPPEESIDGSENLDRRGNILNTVFLNDDGQIDAILGVFPDSWNSELESKVWIFEARNESFNIVLDDRLDDLGGRLLKASPFIRRCVDIPMKEQREKCIKFPEFESQTFKNVLYFVSTETLPHLEVSEIAEVYRFSHMYELEALRQKCAVVMVDSLDFNDCTQLQTIADFFSDKRFLELLYIKRENDLKVWSPMI